MKYVKKYLIVFGTVMLLGFLIYFWIPIYKNYLVHEDSLVENLSAGFYLISFLVSMFFLFKNKMHRKALSIISSVSLLGFLDEISFGANFSAFSFPSISGLHFDAVHDLFEFSYQVVIDGADKYMVYFGLLALAGLIILTVLLLKFGDQLTESITRNYNKSPFILASFFVILIFFALMIDLGIVHIPVLFMVEELFEMNASMALLFCCFSLQKPFKMNQTQKAFEQDGEMSIS